MKKVFLFQFYKHQFFLQTNRRSSYCHTLRRREQKREQKRVEVTSALQILNIQYKISHERARERFPKQSTSRIRIDGWGTLPAKDISPHWSCQELSQPEQTAFWQLKPEVFPLVLPLPRWLWAVSLCNLGQYSRQLNSKKGSGNHVTTGHCVESLN